MFKYLCYSTAFIFSFSNCSQHLFVPYQDKHIFFQGRITFRGDAAELSWPGTSVSINFEGTDISAQVKDGDTSNYYNVIIDNDSIYKIHFDTLKKTYSLASHLHFGKHSVQLFKRTEWDKGKTWFYGFEFNGKIKLLDPPQPPKRKIEFYGNSITCGYALEDTVNDSYVGYYENCYDAYAAITARYFNAQNYLIAKSGIGITISWFPLLMPEMFDRLDPTDPDSKWDFSKYTPDIVVINLLQNDCWLVNKPEHEQFKNRFGTTPPSEEYIIQAYKNFVQSIRNKYPNAQIICMLGNMDITRKGSPWPGYVQKAIEPLNDKKIFTFFVPYKETSGHPKKEEQKHLAESLIEFINEHIKW